MKVIKNYFYNAIYQIFQVLIPFITIPYLSRVLGPKGIGINSYTNSIIQYFILLSDLGITVYGNRRIAYIRDNHFKLTQNFYEIMILQTCVVIITYGLFLIFLIFANETYRPYYLAQSIMIIAMAFDISWFFMGVENFKITVFRNFLVRLIILFCIFIFVKSYKDLMIYIILYASSFLIGNITLFSSLHKYIGLPNVKDLHVIRHLLPAFLLFVPQIAGFIYGIFGKSMLGVLDSSRAVGYFDQADKIDSMLLAIVTATGTVMLPHVAHAFAKGKIKETKIFLYHSFSIVTSLSVPISFGLIAIAFKFVPLFFSSKFMIVAPLMIIEAITVVIISWSNAIGIQYLLPTKQTKLYTISIFSGSVVNIALDIPLIIYLGVYGAVISYVISECTVTIYQLFVIRKQISYKMLFKDIYKYILSGIIMFAIVNYINDNSVNSWIMVVCEICIGAIVYVLLLFLLRANVFNVIKMMVKNKG